MGDWVILRFPYNKPDAPEVVEVLANVPLNWKKYLKGKAKKTKKAGRYLVSSIHYKDEYYFPESKRKTHKKKEKDSE